MNVPELYDKLNSFDIILASKSPRRRQLLHELGLKFRVADNIDVNEDYPESLKSEEIPLYLAVAKARSHESMIKDNTLLITADTIVWYDNQVLGKPANHKEAFEILKKLSGKQHQVYTGVCLKTGQYEKSFFSCSTVHFRQLTDEEINYYIQNFRPFDKAGAYGVQEWIGYIGIEHIEGSYFNVMGLPLQQLYCELQKLLS